jgi:hypothetical protein
MDCSIVPDASRISLDGVKDLPAFGVLGTVFLWDFDWI